jgi:hypothetical protein
MPESQGSAAQDERRERVPGLNVPETSPIFKDAMRTVRGWTDTLRSDREFCAAMDVLKACQADPTLGELLSELLPFFACLAVPRRGGKLRKALEKIWASDTGKTWRALKDFPVRLRGIADEVERINRSGFVSPSIWIAEDQIKARVVKAHFLRLPGVLRFYAVWLEMLIAKKVPVAWERHFPSRPRGHSSFVFHVSHLVKAITGRFHDKEVCNLLDAAACALGIDYQFDPILLAQARKRHTSKDHLT